MFRLLNMGLEVFSRIISPYRKKQLQERGEGSVRLADILKKLTAPETLDMLDRTTGVSFHVDLDRAKSPGFVELVKPPGDFEVRQSLGILLEVTRGMAQLKR